MSVKNRNHKSIYIYIIFCIICCFITDVIIYLYLNQWLIIKISIACLINLLYIIIFLLSNKTKIIKRIIIILTTINISIIPIISLINDYSFKNSTNYGWEKYSKYPVLGNIKTGSFFDPHVIKVRNEYYMYFSDRKNWSIALSKSFDWINRSSPILVLSSSGDNNREKIINRACVIYKDNKFLMRYTWQFDGKSSIWYAESIDGINFTKFDSNPIMVPELDFEQKSIMNPNVIYDRDNNKYKMYYAAWEQFEPDCIWYAESFDGINRNKMSTPILEKSHNLGSYDYYKVWATDVHKMRNWKYIMFYIWYTDIHTWRIMFAISDDGIHREKDKEYIIASSKFWFDGNSVYKPSVLFNEKENKWLLWYNGRLVDREYIWLAECSNCIFNEIIFTKK